MAKTGFHVLLKNPNLISLDMISADDLACMIHDVINGDALDFEIRKTFINEVMRHGPNLMIASDEKYPLIYKLFRPDYIDIFDTIPYSEKLKTIAFCKKSHLLFFMQSMQMNRFDIADIVFASGFKPKVEPEFYYTIPIFETKYPTDQLEDWLKYFNKRGFDLNEFFKMNPNIIRRNIFDLFLNDIKKYDKLLEYGLDIELGDASGNTLAHHLTGISDPKDIQRLIDRGCNINAINDLGETPIMYAINTHTNICTRTIELLLSYDPKLDVKNSKGQDVLDIILCNSNYAARRLKILDAILDKYPHVDLNRKYVPSSRSYDRSLYDEIVSTFGSHTIDWPRIISYT